VITASEFAVKMGGKGLESPCKDGGVGCTTQKLSDGSLLGVWETPRPIPRCTRFRSRGGSSTPAFSSRTAGLFPSGTGFQGKGRLGHLLKTPPLTRAQLTKLIQNPALRQREGYEEGAVRETRTAPWMLYFL
jgi:hypothetical protein